MPVHSTLAGPSVFSAFRQSANSSRDSVSSDAAEPTAAASPQDEPRPVRHVPGLPEHLRDVLDTDEVPI
jgi:hypothetical protein